MKVRLKPRCVGLHKVSKARFNSMKVRLKHLTVDKLTVRQTSFNSMKVRLKQQVLRGVALGVALFQFQEGPIKTALICGKCNVQRCFNSMKVRLKRNNASYLTSYMSFQFHEGPIKTWSEKMANQQNQVSIP